LVQIASNWVCSDCKPAFLSRVMASGAAGAFPLGRHYGGFWIRWVARLLDSVVLGVPVMIIVMIIAMVFLPGLIGAARVSQGPNAFPNAAFLGAFGTFFALFFVVGACYEILMLKYYSGTVGKMACGLKVIRPDGRDLGWGVCFGRFFMWNIVTSGIPYLNFVLMLISSIMAGTDGEKRALHDRVCDTRVVYKQRAA
jgi:uncharacterized RDD family membrane protein YckC